MFEPLESSNMFFSKETITKCPNKKINEKTWWYSLVGKHPLVTKETKCPNK